METSTLKRIEEELRGCYEHELCLLDVGGHVPVRDAERVRLYGALWHHAHELLKAVTGDGGTVELRASGLREMK